MREVEVLLGTLIEETGLVPKTAGDKLMNEVTGVYISDLLSDVMANSKKNELWMTLQVHPNIVAVATLKELSGIILVNGRQPEEETLQRAEAAGIPVMTSDLPAFQLAGKLYKIIEGC